MSKKPLRIYDAETRSDPDFPWLDIDEYFCFPDPEETQGSVVAVGGNLSPGMIVSAYTQGIFPWFNDDDPIYWQSPDPRFVVLPENFHVPGRLERTIKKTPFRILTDTAFERVINFCSGVSRSGQDGSWITDDIIDAYIALHRQGLAHSVEAWQDGHLVGGFYGVLLGSVFFGESMFTRVPDSSKTAFAVFARYFFNEMNGRLIDSQVYTDHIARFGGTNISRAAYLRKLSECLPCGCAPGFAAGTAATGFAAGTAATGFAAGTAATGSVARCQAAEEPVLHLQRGLWQPEMLCARQHFASKVILAE